MIIKSSEDKKLQIDVLKVLQLRTDITAEQKKRIEQEIKNIYAGTKGEREAAYEIDFHYGASKNWMIIHDLRIECDGRIAQIDHLLINRFFEVWVCESKHLSEGLAINEHGECSAFFHSKPYGVPSPLEQNRKHISVLESVFKSNMVKLPTRLGFNIKPSIYSLILVSKNARISRPKVKIDGIDTIIKNDQFKNKIDKKFDDDNNVLGLVKLVNCETLEDFANQLASLHTPIEFDWHAKFGLPKIVTTVNVKQEAPLKIDAPVTEPSTQQVPEVEEKVEATRKPKQKLICNTCSQPVTYTVAKFCWFNKPKFSGNIYCMECQKLV